MNRTHRSGLAVVLLLSGWTATAQAEIVITDRLSEIRYSTVNLTDGTPPPAQEAGLTDLYAPFAHSFSVGFDHFTIVGHHNTGSLYVYQNSNISTSTVFVDTLQNGITTTDLDSPALSTRSVFTLDFHVAAPVDVVLTGLIAGSSDPAQSSFGRVQLVEDTGPMFSTTFGNFPFVGVLTPGHTYQLQVESHGSAQINGSTNSRALVSMDIGAPPIAEPATRALWALGAVALAALRLRQRSLAGPGPTGAG